MSNNRSMPPGVIIPELPYLNVLDAADWLCRVLGFKQRLQIGNHRFQLSFGEGAVVVTQKDKKSDTTCTVMVSVADVDKHYEHAKQSGAQIINQPTDYPYGERQYVVEDPGGHRWTFHKPSRILTHNPGAASCSRKHSHIKII